MKFNDREDAANLLLKALETYKGSNPLVLGIPRGAIPMAALIAQGLEGELGAVLVHKIPAPFNEELAVASIGLSGQIQKLNLIHALNISDAYLAAAAKQQYDILKARQKKYGLKDPEYQNRIVIIVDDGIATGATTLSAINEIKFQNPQKIVVATPVASPDSAKKIRAAVDELLVLYEPENFYAVGQFYDNFDQVSDEEVIDILKNAQSKKGEFSP